LKEKVVKFLYAIDCYLLYLLSGVVAAAGVVAYYSITAALDYGYIGEETDANAFVDYISGFMAGKASLVLIVSYLLVIITVFFVFLFMKRRVTAYTGMSYANLLSIIAAILSGIVLNFITYSFVPVEMTQAQEINLLLILCVVLGPFVEELMFRGILLKMFAGACGIIFASIITSLLFAIMHTEPVQMLYTFVLGIILCLVRVSSTSLWSAVALHLAFNITGAVALVCDMSFDGASLAMICVAAILLISVACMGGRRLEKEKKESEA